MKSGDGRKSVLSLNQVMFGRGQPDILQSNWTCEPSITICDDSGSINKGGATSRVKSSSATVDNKHEHANKGIG